MSDTVFIRVETWHNGAMESIREGDHADREFRQWMGKHAFWAMRNGREMRTIPVSVAHSIAKAEGRT